MRDDKPVRLGGRALDILIELVTHAGQVISKDALMSRVWREVVVDEGSLRVHISALRRALGDDCAPHQYIVNISGRGYSFVAPMVLSAAQAAVEAPPEAYRYDLPVALTRMVGRADIVASLIADLPLRRLITIVGSGGIGKTRVALAVAEAIAPSYPDGARFVDLSPVGDAQLVPSVVASALGMSSIPSDPTSNIIAFVRDKQLLLILDSCEHILEETAALAERVLQYAPGAHILATSREPLRIHGEWLRRLPTLAAPPVSSKISADTALAFPAVELFVERAAAALGSFALDDAGAPVVVQICQKLDGIPLAIELVAGRVESFGIRGLARILEDGFELLAEGGGSTIARHRTMNDTLEWSYRWLAAPERAMLCRLAVFAGSFGIAAVRAVVADVETRASVVAERLANLVSKSLVIADPIGTEIAYRLHDTTRAYALEKLRESGRFDDCARRHAQHHLDRLERAEADWQTRTSAECLAEYGDNIDDVRAALSWAFSPTGDAPLGIALTVASVPLWMWLSLLHECRERIEKVLACLPTHPTLRERYELRLRVRLGLILPAVLPCLPENGDFWAETLALAEKANDFGAQGEMLFQWSIYHMHAGKFHQQLAVAEKCRALLGVSADPMIAMSAEGIAVDALYHLGAYADAVRRIEALLKEGTSPGQRNLIPYHAGARCTYANVLWVQGFPDQALDNARAGFEEAKAIGNTSILAAILAKTVCHIALLTGEIPLAEYGIEFLLDQSAKSGMNNWSALGYCFKGALLLLRGDLAGQVFLRKCIEWLRKTKFAYGYALSLAIMARAQGAAGQTADAHLTIDEALARSDCNDERWCMPELLRIKGELLRVEPSAKRAAEDFFLRSLDWARRQEALSWELRTAMSLAELWRQNGNVGQALELLSAVYGRFTEGFETADLQRASALIGQLRSEAALPASWTTRSWLPV